MTTARQPFGATPERPPQTAPPRARPAHGDASAPAESVRVTDVPAAGRGRAYLVERGLEQDGNDALRALVDDYVQQAERHGEIPMSAPTQRWLNHAEDPHE